MVGIESYFDKETMSVHIRENNFPSAKKGTPEKWEFKKISNRKITLDEVKALSQEIIESGTSFVEIERSSSSIIQKGDIRIVITRPPLSDAWEITAVKPVKLLKFSEYALSEKLKNRLAKQAEGILVAGSPGQGKTTFARALAIYYAENDKIVKTVESPRDLILPDNITQLSLSYGTPEELQDILLLSRPDYTIFDEMRNKNDFQLFSELRLSGVGMIGIVHATSPVDAIQRFIGKIDLGVIPQIIDTVVFIKAGKISMVYDVKITVKSPTGMVDSNLARPVVTVCDFETGRLEFEIYSYGEETVVVPAKKNSINENKEIIEKRIKKVCRNASVAMTDGRYFIYLPEDDLTKIDNLVEGIQDELGIKISIRKLPKNYKVLKFALKADKRYISLVPSEDATLKDVEILADNSFILSAKVSKKNIIKINSDSEQGKKLAAAIASGKKIEMRE